MASGKLKIDIRRQKILEQLQNDGQVTVNDLSLRLGITPVTIRNDLDMLAQEGRLERIQGGAISKQEGLSRGREKAISFLAEKQAIAKGVLSQIRDGDILFINSGSTTLVIAQALRQRKFINVVTNSLAVANCLSHLTTIRLVLLGGELNATYGFTYGGDAVEQLKKYQPEWSILSVDGVDPEKGLTTYHAEEVMIDRMMMEQSHRTIIAADHQKIGKVGFSHICEFSPEHILVTDAAGDPTVLDALKNIGGAVWVTED